MSVIAEFWHTLPARMQDGVLLSLVALWPILVILLIHWRYRLWTAVRGLLRKHVHAASAMILLIAIATMANLLFSMLERAIVSGSARASDPFDLIISSPGSKIDALLTTVYLQAHALPLLPAEVLLELSRHPDVEFAAPVGFGDSLGDYPLIGTSTALLNHLTDSPPDRKWFSGEHQVLAGSATNVSISDKFPAMHGFSDSSFADDTSEHTGIKFEVVKRLPATGTQWDHAMITSIGELWTMHGLGHHSHEFIVNDHTPPVPIIVVKAKSVSDLYALRQQFNTADTMAFFPAEVLAGLYRVLGSVATIVYALTLTTQVLVIVAVLLGVYILMRSMTTRFATLHALGAPQSYRFCLIWVFSTSLIVCGILLGSVLGYAAAYFLAPFVSGYLQLPVVPELAASELFSSAIFFNATLLLASLVAWLLSRRQKADALYS